MDEINDLLNIKEETSKSSSQVNSPVNDIPWGQQQLTINRPETALTGLAYVICYGGIIASIIAAILIWRVLDHTEFDDFATFVAIAVLVVGSFYSLVVSWFLMVVANISNNIREIKRELRKK